MNTDWNGDGVVDERDRLRRSATGQARRLTSMTTTGMTYNGGSTDLFNGEILAGQCAVFWFDLSGATSDPIPPAACTNSGTVTPGWSVRLRPTPARLTGAMPAIPARFGDMGCNDAPGELRLLADPPDPNTDTVTWHRDITGTNLATNAAATSRQPCFELRIAWGRTTWPTDWATQSATKNGALHELRVQPQDQHRPVRGWQRKAG